MTEKDIKRHLNYDLELLKLLRTENEGKDTYVVANQRYVRVLPFKSISKSEYCAITPSSGCIAAVYYSKKDAEERGLDYYLVDKNGNKIELEIIKATDFYTSVIKIAESFIEYLKMETK